MYGLKPKSIHYGILSAALIVATAAWALDLDFYNHRVDSVLTGAIEVGIADIDGDGDADLAGVGWDGDAVAWYENSGDEVFVKHTLASANGPRSITVVGPDGGALDLDGDGDGDILVAATEDNDVLWYRNDGAGVFTKITVDANLPSAHTVAVADVDLDGDLDLAATGIRSAWYENDGAQNFARHDLGAFTTLGCCIQLVDMDGDGDHDVFEVHQGSVANLVWWENDGGGGFARHDIADGYFNAHTGFAGDIDGDGDMDLATSAWMPGNVSWWENDGTMTFTRITLDTDVGSPFWSEPVDLDSDGDTDILCASSTRAAFWYENDGEQSFTRRIVNSNLDGAFCARPGDIDGDGDLDVVSCSRTLNRVAWSENASVIAIEDDDQPDGPPRPDAYGLDVSPNPFNPCATISYELPEPSSVRLEVWDVSGRRVALLVDGVRPAGRYTEAWAPGDLPSGVYSCRLTAGDMNVVTRKMTLLK